MSKVCAKIRYLLPKISLPSTINTNTVDHEAIPTLLPFGADGTNVNRPGADAADADGERADSASPIGLCAEHPNVDSADALD